VFFLAIRLQKIIENKNNRDQVNLSHLNSVEEFSH